MISVSKKFLFIHIKKTGGNSIQKAIAKYSDDIFSQNSKQKVFNKQKGEVHRFGILRKHIPGKKHSSIGFIYKNWNPPALGPWEDYHKFCCIRNTWDRLISFYFSPHLGNTEFNRDKFNALIQSLRHQDQLHFTCINDHFAMDEILRFENLNVDFNQLCKKLGLITELPHINKGNHHPYQYYYNVQSRELVKNLYAREIEKFNFTFE